MKKSQANRKLFLGRAMCLQRRANFLPQPNRKQGAKMSKPTNKEILKEVNENLPKLMKARPELKEAFMDKLMPACMNAGAIDEKQKELVALGIAITSECDYCIAMHVKKCLDTGATRDEITDVCGVAVMMGGGPSLMYSCQVMKALDEMEAE
jgi:AhpD family alkylhydroperoxidase